MDLFTELDKTMEELDCKIYEAAKTINEMQGLILGGLIDSKGVNNNHRDLIIELIDQNNNLNFAAIDSDGNKFSVTNIKYNLKTNCFDIILKKLI